ncbi:MAG: prolyl oligopeptidase family serine peptidase [Chlamydiales bacterium]|nr:prolyl oligopeptidase family serine peptidase [Chlamydiales bacterium]
MDDADRPLPIDRIDTPSGAVLYHLGPSLDQGKRPSVFYFALSGEESLLLDPFNQPAVALADAGIRVFSVDIPYHGSSYAATQAMRYWAEELGNNNDFLSPFFDQVCGVIDFALDNEWIDPHALGTIGLSRGGFIATHVAARHHDVKYVVGFAPMTQFGLMDEFHERQLTTVAEKLALTHIADKLIGRQVRYYIGNRDQRVGTDACYHFVRALVEANFSQGKRSPPVDLIITPSIGHKGHGTSPETFASGADFMVSVIA